MKKICVIGAGAAGMMAAGIASQLGADVTVFEHSDKPGRKIAITGKGRCNVTNASTIDKLLENTPKNPRFLYAAFNAFSADDTMQFFEELGVPLKIERGSRVFPVSDKAFDIVDALKRHASEAKIIFEHIKRVKVNENGGFTVFGVREYSFDSVIIATGGKSYPATGSDGSGYSIASKLGHSVTELSPSLIPLTSSDTICKELQGLSLKNVSIKIFDKNGKIIYEDFGEMMFTHFGVTGPMILSASARIKKYINDSPKLEIDLKPALSDQELDTRILSDFSEVSNKIFANSLTKLLPSKMIDPFVKATGISPAKKVNSITKAERQTIRDLFKHFSITLDGMRPISEAIITSGGIDVKEINPKTMESKIIPDLYFAGEIIDVDAYTGGFNLQIAFSTGFLAGKSAAEK